MIFSSPLFLFVFLPFLFVFYLISPNRYKNIILLIFSLIFYFWGSGYLLFLLLFSIASNYFFGLKIEDAEEKKLFWLVFAVTTNIGLLLHFKYLNFFVKELNNVFKIIDIPAIPQTDIILPIGISFFTFQALSYIIDTYRSRTKAQRNPFDFALYISMFPQLIAGPIVRFVHISDQIKNRVFSVDLVYSGLCRFIFGLSKKVIIADQLAYVVDGIIQTNHTQLSVGAAWIAILCFALQIYYDFSGYSDMAIGLGRIFGFKFFENFDYPYVSKSITEFWRRWHISLSTWFKDYLYIPLGGNRVSAWKNNINLLIVFILCGLWHGASWNFVIWGLFHGAFLMLEKSFFLKTLSKIPAFFNHLYVIIIILVSWVFFRMDTFEQSIFYLKKMLFMASTEPVTQSLSDYINSESVFYIALAIIFSMPLIPFIKKKLYLTKLFKQNEILPEFARIGFVLSLLTYSIMVLSSSSYRPFIYFKF